mmetsp:Transcript_10368/g.22697  ORF Transcript_10368/g.22697 Transcript_10368/m.22697 type:complete len:311 (-) Transcript_10368:38-970(-)
MCVIQGCSILSELLHGPSKVCRGPCQGLLIGCLLLLGLLLLLALSLGRSLKTLLQQHEIVLRLHLRTVSIGLLRFGFVQHVLDNLNNAVGPIMNFVRSSLRCLHLVRAALQQHLQLRSVIGIHNGSTDHSLETTEDLLDSLSLHQRLSTQLTLQNGNSAAQHVNGFGKLRRYRRIVGSLLGADLGGLIQFLGRGLLASSQLRDLLCQGVDARLSLLDGGLQFRLILLGVCHLALQGLGGCAAPMGELFIALLLLLPLSDNLGAHAFQQFDDLGNRVRRHGMCNNAKAQDNTHVGGRFGWYQPTCKAQRSL